MKIFKADVESLTVTKISPTFLSNRFIDIINAVFSTSEFLTCEKRGLIYPLIEAFSLNPEVLGNYRPITNVSYVSKLIETAIYSQLLTHVEHNFILPATQSAYGALHFTETITTRVFSDIISNMESNLHTIAVYLDLSNAFDSIDHSILLDELHSIGVRGKALETPHSYLTDRLVQVTTAGYVSEPLPLKYGVPQGSVLGPLLFVLWTRRLSAILNELGLTHHIYADNTQFYCSFREDEIPCIKEKIATALRYIKVWMNSMKLKLNINKTNFIIFSPTHKKQFVADNFRDLVVDNICLSPSQQVKTLGVTLDSDLTFIPHIDNVVLIMQVCYP